MKLAVLTLVVGLFAGAVLTVAMFAINGKTLWNPGGTLIVNGRVLLQNLVQGSGNIATENRTFDGFTEITQDISADITVTAGEKSTCKITADDNLLPLILTERSGNALHITSNENFSSTRKITIAIETPLLTKAKLNGSGRFDIADVTKDKLELEINGSGDMTVKGKVAELTATINGSGNVNAARLQAAKATVAVQGSGDAEINATDALTVEIHGSGKVTYAGKPKLHTSVTGSGEISNK